MKRFLAVALIALGLSFSIDAHEPIEAQTSTTESSAQQSTPRTVRKRPRRRIRRTRRHTARRTTSSKKIAPKPSATEWATFTSKAGRFSVLMPGKPTDTTETFQSEHGPYTSHLMKLRDTRNVFLIAWVDYDPSFDFHRQMEMEMNRDVFVTDMKAKLVDSREVMIDGYRAIEFTAETAEKVYKSRIYMVGRRPYQIVIGSPKGEDDSAAVERFLNSFKVTLN